MAFVRGGNIWVAEVGSGHERQITHKWKKDVDPESGNDISLTWNRRYNLITFSHPESFNIVPVGEKKGKVVTGMSIYDVWPDKHKGIYWDTLYPNSTQRKLGPNSQGLYIRFDIWDDNSTFIFSEHDHPVWDPSGTRLAFSRNGDLWVSSVYTGDTGDPADLPKTFLWECSRVKAAAEYDAGNWHSSRATTAVSKLSWSPDGQSILCSTSRRRGSGIDEVRLVTFTWQPQKDREPIVKTNKRLMSDDVREACFSPDGKSFLYVNYEAEVHIRTLDGKHDTKILSDAYNPDW